MEDDTFFHFYQTLSTEDENSRSASEKADCKRKIAAQVECLSKTNRDCANFYVLDQHLVSYASIVDEKDTTSGLNNYAAGALALTSTSKNESKSWSISGLASSDRFRSLQSCVQNKNEATQKLRKKLDEAYVTLQHKSTAPVAPSFKKSASVGDYDSVKPQSNRDVPKFANQVNNSRTTIGGMNSARKPFPTSPDHVTNQRGDASSAKENPTYGGHFRTARDQLIIENQQKNNNRNSCTSSGPQYAGNMPSRNKSLGTRRGLKSPFVPPIKETSNGDSCELNGPKQPGKSADELQDPRLKNIEPKMVELIENEIMDHGPPTTWDHIAGLEFAKATIKEIVVWPMLRPDIFTGLRGPPRGILLFGPPGTGKTLIGKCIASQSHSTFFSISASSLTSKWVGDGEKMVRALFAVARVHQPSVIFIDEIDSLLSQRSDTEHESSRRIKTEFLVQLDGATTSQEDRLLVVGATNRPQELDEAARRRLVKRLYIPLPEMEARKQIIRILMESQHNCLNESDINEICSRTDGYSGADMTNLCREAALGPIRAIPMDQIEHISPDQVRPICYDDFVAALNQVKASVSDEDLALYEDWNRRYGSVSK